MRLNVGTMQATDILALYLPVKRKFIIKAVTPECLTRVSDVVRPLLRSYQLRGVPFLVQKSVWRSSEARVWFATQTQFWCRAGMKENRTHVLEHGCSVLCSRTQNIAFLRLCTIKQSWIVTFFWLVTFTFMRFWFLVQWKSSFRIENG